MMRLWDSITQLQRPWHGRRSQGSRHARTCYQPDLRTTIGIYHSQLSIMPRGGTTSKDLLPCIQTLPYHSEDSLRSHPPCIRICMRRCTLRGFSRTTNVLERSRFEIKKPHHKWITTERRSSTPSTIKFKPINTKTASIGKIICDGDYRQYLCRGRHREQPKRQNQCENCHFFNHIDKIL